jgi:hypothetical protein
LTLDPYVVNKIEELTKERHMSKSRIVESVFSLGATRFEQLYEKSERVPANGPTEDVKPDLDNKSKGERLAEAYMRRKLFSNDEQGWAPV